MVGGVKGEVCNHLKVVIICSADLGGSEWLKRDAFFMGPTLLYLILAVMKFKKTIKKMMSKLKNVLIVSFQNTSLHHLHVKCYLTQAQKQLVCLKHRKGYYLAWWVYTITPDETDWTAIISVGSFVMEIYPTC